MKNILTLALLFSAFVIKAQVVEVYTGSPEYLTGEKSPIELFSRGLIDYGFEGQLQTTAQAVKINVGEPTKFYVPIYLLVGATNGNFGSNEINKSTVLELINPHGGLLNLSGNIYRTIFASSTDVTSLKFNAYFGGKLISGRDAVNDNAAVKPAGFADAGLYFQTGAWLGDEEYKDGGVFWLQIKYSAIAIEKQDLETYFGSDVDTAPHGPRCELGIFIKDRVNIKLSYYKAIGGTEIHGLNDGQFRLALDYNVNN